MGHIWSQRSQAFWGGKGYKVAKSGGTDGCSKIEFLAAQQMQ